MAPKDNVASTTAPANAINTDRIKIKGFDSASLPNNKLIDEPSSVWDPASVKSPDCQCTTSLKKGRVTGVINQYSEWVDRIPQYVKDLDPILRSTASVNNDSEAYSVTDVFLNNSSENSRGDQIV